MSTRKKAISRSGLNSVSPEQQQIIDNSQDGASGYGGRKLIEGIPTFAKTDSEVVIGGENNSQIVFGRDRPGGKLSPYINHTQAGSIDIVAGRMGWKATSYLNGEYIITDPDFKLDAARIYISQKTNIDENFGIKPGQVGNPSPRSGIAIKADGVRIIAREGIKLVTKTDSTNSQGGELLDSVSGIDLLASNDETILEPIPKGHRLEESLKSLTNHVSKLNGIVDKFLTHQMKVNNVLMNHTHPSPNPATIQTPAPGVIKWETFPSLPVYSDMISNQTELLSGVKTGLVTHKINLGNYQNKYLSPFGHRYINSYFNNTT